MRALIFTSLMMAKVECESSSVISSLVSVASCRAMCLDQTGDQCWDLCYHVAHHPDTCAHPDCGQDCAAVCRHYSLSNQTPVSKPVQGPVAMRYQFARVPKISGCTVSWPPLTPVTNIMTMSADSSDEGTVYLVLGQDRAGQWYELSHTRATWSVLDGQVTAKLDTVVIMGVRSDGVHDSVILEMDGLRCDQIRTQHQQQAIEDVQLTPHHITTLPGQDVHDVILQWAGELDGSPRYLVQWQRVPQLSPLDIVGNLVTGATHVKLSLEEDSVYVVSVKDIRTGRKSPATIISTSMTQSDSETYLGTAAILCIILTLIIPTSLAIFFLCRRHVSKQSSDSEVQENMYNDQYECKARVLTLSQNVDVGVKTRVESMAAALMHSIKQKLRTVQKDRVHTTLV